MWDLVSCCPVAHLCVILCDSMDCCMPSFPVPHNFPKFAQAHVHCIGDAIQPSHLWRPPFIHPQSFPASGTFPMSRLFASDDQNAGASASTSAPPMSIQCWFPSDWLVWSPCSLGDFQESSPAPQFESISSLAFCLLYGPALKPVCDHWEDHSLNCLHLCHQSLCFLTHCLDLSQLSCQEAIMTRDQTMKAWILNHWTIREVLHFLFLNCCPETQVSEIPKSYMSIPVPAWVTCYNSLLQKTDSLIAWGIEKGVHFQTLACLSGGSLGWVDGVACPRVCSQGSSWDRMASEVKVGMLAPKLVNIRGGLKATVIKWCW